LVVDKPSPSMLKTLRQAQLYGYLIARDDALFHPGGNHSLCGLHHARQMVRSGWLMIRNGRYELTPEGQRVLEANLAALLLRHHFLLNMA
jgi:hypothetical protein